MNQSENTPHGSSGFKQAASRSIGPVLVLVLWFFTAGRVSWIQGWLLIIFFLVFVTLLLIRLMRIDPDLVKERNRPAENVEPWDRTLLTIYTGFLVGLLFLAALDSGRFGWSDIPIWLQVGGWVLLVIASAVVWHVMEVNPYLSSWVRLQDERGQRVVHEGLYSRIRHPMYLGILLAFLGLPLALGSYFAMFPALVILGLFIYRTSREDKMLNENLDGYREYAEHVRYRLIPWVW